MKTMNPLNLLLFLQGGAGGGLIGLLPLAIIIGIIILIVRAQQRKTQLQSSETPEGLSVSQRVDEQIRAVDGDYLVIPFIGKIKSGLFSSESAEAVSRQLQSLINQYSQQGWEFHNIAKVDIEVTPGCLAGLFGAKTSYITFDQAVFRRARP